MKYSEACERNKGPILEILANYLSDKKTVLEIGSGTGQHAVHFGKNLSNVSWHTSDLRENLPDLLERIQIEGSENVILPVELNVTQQLWPFEEVDAVYTANTLHIMPWVCVPDFFSGAGRIIGSNGLIFIYGPFKYDGNFTSQSNAEFDEWLKKRNNESGIRNFEDVNDLAEDQGFKLIKDYSMPANNQLIVWGK